MSPDQGQSQSQSQSPPRTALQILEDTCKFFEDHDWTNGEAGEARDEVGRPCPATAVRARKWTPYGAIKKVASMGHPLEDYVTPMSWIKMHIRTQYNFPTLEAWNNAPGQTKESILLVLQEVVERVKAAN